MSLQCLDSIKPRAVNDRLGLSQAESQLLEEEDLLDLARSSSLQAIAHSQTQASGALSGRSDEACAQ